MLPLLTTLLLMTPASEAVAPPLTRLPVIPDDYARARSEADRRGVPLFVEVWAPW